MRVALYTECYHPIVNGIVASIDALRSGLTEAGIAVETFAPRFPGHRDDDASIVRLPSLALPTRTGYRLCLPSKRMFARPFDIVHAHSLFITGRLAREHARRLGVPLVYTYHTRLEEYAHYARFERRITRVALRRMTRDYANSSDVVIAPTHAMEERLRELGVVVPIDVVPSAIDVDGYARARRDDAQRARLGGANGPLVLLVGRLAHEKNVGLALETIAAAPTLRLAIVGDGPLRGWLEARAAALGIAGRVCFAGQLSPARLPAVYAASDVLLFTSVSETQGLVLAEALAAALPIVAVDSAATREVVGPFATLRPADPAELARGLLAALERGGDRAASAAARATFGRDRHAERVLSVYHAAHERQNYAAAR